MIVDCVTFNGEYDLLDIRLNILGPHVDRFIICEAPTTFSGLPKPLYYERGKERYRRWHDKITYFVIEGECTDESLVALADGSVLTRGAAHWKREFYQKESIKKGLVGLDDNDIVFVGDVDEIPDLEVVLKWCHAPFKWKLNVYTYFLNNKSSEEFWGFIASPYYHIKHSCLNDLRNNSWKTVMYGGWHFTSMGGIDEMRRKLRDSYTEETYNSPAVQEHLAENMASRKDFLGRNFTYTVDESAWPQYLKDNKETYKHLCL